MSKVKILSFEDALNDTEQYRTQKGNLTRHLLTGNGFSMAYDPKRFSYSALFDVASQALPLDVQQMFTALEVKDFELVMRMYQDAAVVLSQYPQGSKFRQLFERNAEEIRDALARAVSASHPDRPGDIAAKQYTCCRSFLRNFDCIYTLNYDLLPYWAFMQDLETALKHDDGFRQPEDGKAEYVTWDVQNSDNQSVFYLHGALHIFDAGHEVQKYTWCNTGEPLIEQIRSALAANKFPIFVAEGTSNEKYAKIQHSSFLGRAYRSFAKGKSVLFIHGHSLEDTDDHILRLLSNGKRTAIYVSIFGDPTAIQNKKIIKKAQQFSGSADGDDVKFYDAESAHVWS